MRNIYAALLVIYGGKVYKRGVEYDITTSLAIMMMGFDAILSALPHGHLHIQCSTLKKARHERSPDMARNYNDIKSWLWYVINIKSSRMKDNTLER